MAYVDENGKEHCCEECAKGKTKSPVPWGALLVGAATAVAVSGIVLTVTRAPRPEERDVDG